VTESKVFQTFARTLPPSSKVSKPVVALLKNFQWDQFVIVVGRRQEWNQLKDAVIVS
jgi:guanylate cyclase, other